MATVLVVDDVEMFRSVVANALKRAGHHTICAADGAAALQVLESERIDLVLLDLAMPNMNGIEFLERLRADERFANVQVIVVSASSERPQAQTPTAPGAQARLLKSRFSLRDLIQCVNGLVKPAA
jgi:CheY-like chemotaxis protein